jgi:hypothetical protein
VTELRRSEMSSSVKVIRTTTYEPTRSISLQGVNVALLRSLDCFWFCIRRLKPAATNIALLWSGRVECFVPDEGVSGRLLTLLT